MPFRGNSFNVFGVIKSMPGAFFVCESHISSLISFGLMFYEFNCLGW